MRIHNSKSLLERRRDLRNNSTYTEELLWEEIRGSKLGFKLKRQHSIGKYIIDFFCSSKRLIVEIDGGIHELKDNQEYDLVRDKFFTDLGYTVLRIKSNEVEDNMKEVLQKIRGKLASIPFSLPRRRGRG